MALISKALQDKTEWKCPGFSSGGFWSSKQEWTEEGSSQTYKRNGILKGLHLGGKKRVCFVHKELYSLKGVFTNVVISNSQKVWNTLKMSKICGFSSGLNMCHANKALLTPPPPHSPWPHPAGTEGFSNPGMGPARGRCRGMGWAGTGQGQHSSHRITVL